MPCRLLVLAPLVLSLIPAPSPGREAPRGSLLIIGGNDRPDNAPLHDRFLAQAGGKGRARIGIFPTASLTTDSSERMVEQLVRYGVPAEAIAIIGIPGDDPAKANDAEIARRIRGCTGLFFVGGDQLRIARAFRAEDGSDTPALAAVREVFARGGVVAGTSAGAAAMSRPMISVSGLPDQMQDYGMDALDFGRAAAITRRGLFVTRGLGLFGVGLIDQHFDGHRGRFARLARVLIEEEIRYGFGIDENTAMFVRPDGVVEVVGWGGLTIVDASEATATDGPLGFRMAGVRLSHLTSGDRFDPRTGEVAIHPNKAPIATGAESWNGNELITDISGIGALKKALTAGLVDNTSRAQVGIDLRYNGHYGHGYKFTFTETDRTRGYAGHVDGVFTYSVGEVRMDAEPTTCTLEPPSASMPRDAARREIQALVFRGIMVTDDRRQFRPAEPVTRGELANALAHATVMEMKRGVLPPIEDVPPSTRFAAEIAKVVSTGLMTLDRGAFRPSERVARQDAAAVLVRVAETYTAVRLPVERIAFVDGDRIEPKNRAAVCAAVSAGLLEAKGGRFRPEEFVTREELGVALYRILGFPW